MAKVVKEAVKIGRKKFPCYIETSQMDINFLSDVLHEWAGYDAVDTAILIREAIHNGELEDVSLRKRGYELEENRDEGTPPSITLIKLDEGKWVVSGMNYEETEEFAESIEGNVDTTYANEDLKKFEDDFRRHTKWVLVISILVAVLVVILLKLGVSLWTLLAFSCGASVLVWFVVLGILIYRAVRSR